MKALSFYLLLIFIISSATIYGFENSYPKNLPAVTNYELDIKPDFREEKLFARCKITVENTTGEQISLIPLTLYRTLKVTGITDESGKSLIYKQQVVSYEDFEAYQANYIEVTTANPLMQGEEKLFIIDYEGYLLGYTETGMAYVKDNISPIFTIIRPDCNAYPSVGVPSFKINKTIGKQEFNYIISVTVPDTLSVVNGGKLINAESNNRLTTYKYKNIKPAWRIDIAIAKYRVLENNNFRVYYFPEDSTGAKTIMEAAKKTIELFTSWWGPLKNFEGFSVIEIPDGWGSQADVACIIQTAAAFKNASELSQLYHEISHLWNVPEKNGIPTRWDEGLATFIEYLTVEKLENREIMSKINEWSVNNLNDKFANNPALKNIPFVDYGKKGVTGLSYSVGMFACEVLYKMLGEKNFNKALRRFYKDNYEKGGSFIDFVEIAGKLSKKDVKGFISDWITSTNYVRYIENRMKIDDIVKIYAGK